MGKINRNDLNIKKIFFELVPNLARTKLECR